MFRKVILLFFLTIIGALKIFELHGNETTLLGEQNVVTIRKLRCNADIDRICALHSFPSCSFINPARLHIVVPVDSFEDGQCSCKVIITAANRGLWQCHINDMESSKTNTTDLLNILVMDDDAQFAATQQRVSMAHGKEVTLSCNSTDLAPLRYCFFQQPPPTGKLFTIDSYVTPEIPNFERFYIPPNTSLDRGDCALYIHLKASEDIGEWSCFAIREDGRGSSQTIVLGLQGSNTHTALALQSKNPLAVARGSKTQLFVVLGSITGVALFATLLGFFIKWGVRVEPEIEEQSPPRRRLIIPIITIQPPTPTISPNNNSINERQTVNNISPFRLYGA